MDSGLLVTEEQAEELTLTCELSFVACAAIVKLRSGAQGKESQFLKRLHERTAQQLAEPAWNVVKTSVTFFVKGFRRLL